MIIAFFSLHKKVQFHMHGAETAR